MKKYLVILLTLILPIYALLLSCVSTLPRMTPYEFPIDDYWVHLEPEQVEIAMDKDVLKGKGAQPYAKMARKHEVCLVVLTMNNIGKDTFHLPSDLMFINKSGDTLSPLMLEPGVEELIKTRINEDGEEVIWLPGEGESAMEVESKGLLKTLWISGRLANQAKTVISHIRLTEDLSEYYLQDTFLLPGSVVKGFMVIPVGKDIPVDISLKQKKLIQ